VNKTGPRDVGDRTGHLLGWFPARFVTVEQDGDEAGIGMGQPFQLLDRDRGPYQGYSWDAQAMQADCAEVALDHDHPMPAVRDPVQVEQLEIPAMLPGKAPAAWIGTPRLLLG
jgi:hypothetical protein